MQWPKLGPFEDKRRPQWLERGEAGEGYEVSREKVSGPAL